MPGLRSLVREAPIVVPAVCAPAFTMLIGGLVAGQLKVSQWGLCAAQYFSAGMILAVCGNLAGEISGHGISTIVVMMVGFCLGVGSMVLVKKITEGLCEVEDSGNSQMVKSFPWPLVIAVAIDSVVDGLLLGMIGTETPKAVLMVSTATALEMGALGLSFSAALREQSRQARGACVLGMPLALLLGGAVGAFAATPLQNSPLAITGMLSFGISALVYLVIEELLAEAVQRRQEIDKRGSTSSFLFVGYLLVLILDTLEA